MMPREESRAAREGVSAGEGKGCRGVGVPGDQARFLCVSGEGRGAASARAVTKWGKVVFKE
jgi:hypothetical protein